MIVSISDFAKMHNVHPNAIYSAIKNGNLVAVNISKKVRSFWVLDTEHHKNAAYTPQSLTGKRKEEARLQNADGTITVLGAAKVLRLSKRRIIQLIKNGTLAASKTLKGRWAIGTECLETLSTNAYENAK